MRYSKTIYFKSLFTYVFIIFILITINTSFASTPPLTNKKIILANFSQNNMAGWEAHSFEGTTKYQLITQGKKNILKATSKGQASGLIKKQQIDLKQTPFLNWEWKVDNALYRLSETFKEGDDFAARIYVVIDGGVFFWRTLALNYVWSSNQNINTMWDNPFTSNAKMIAIESGGKFKQQWRSEKRNVYEDLQKAYGKNFRFIDAIAIMTDTDNSGQSATAYYGDIYFSEK